MRRGSARFSMVHADSVRRRVTEDAPAGPPGSAAVASRPARRPPGSTRPAAVVQSRQASGRQDGEHGRQARRTRCPARTPERRSERAPGSEAERRTASDGPQGRAPRGAPCARGAGPSEGAATWNSGSRTPHGTKRASITIPGIPVKTVRMKKSRQPSASAATPATGPASTRGIVKRLERSAYCVAEKRFWVRRSRSTPNAPDAQAGGAQLEGLRRVHERPVDAHLGHRGVAEVRDDLQEAEDPERAAEPHALRQHAAQERPTDRRRLADGGGGHAHVEVVEADLDQERPGQRLGQVVATACRGRRRPGSRGSGAGRGSRRTAPTPRRAASSAARAGASGSGANQVTSRNGT